MLETAFLLFFSVTFLFLPLLFWSYVSSTFFGFALWRMHFFMGLFLGALVTIILLLSPYLPFEWGVSNVFSDLSMIQNLSWALGYIVWLSLLCILVLSFFLSISYFFQNSKNIFFKKIFWAALIFFQYILLCAFFSFSLSWLFPQDMKQEIFSWLVLHSLGLIFGYYITLAFLEECGKYSASLSFWGRRESMTLEGTLLVATLIALWFSLFENALYSYYYYQDVWISPDLLRFILFRSIFSTSLHVLASLLISYGFWQVGSKKSFYLPLSLFLFLGFWLHSVFNIMLGFWYVFFLLIPLFGAYIFFSAFSANLSSH